MLRPTDLKLTNGSGSTTFFDQSRTFDAADVAHTPIDDLTPLAGLHRMRELHIEGTAVSDLSAIAKLDRLTELTVDSTPIQSIEPIARTVWLQKAERVDLHGTQLKSLEGIENAQLFLYNTPIEDLRPLSTLHRLQWLNLDNTRATDLAPLTGLSQLQRLSLVNTPLASLDPLKALHGLKELDLSGTHASARDIGGLQKQLPGVDITS